MPTITIENTPESVAAFVASFPPSDRARFDAALQNFATAQNRQPDPKLSQKDLDAIGEGLKAVEEGRTMDGNEFFASLAERHGWAKRAQ